MSGNYYMKNILGSFEVPSPIKKKIKLKLFYFLCQKMCTQAEFV